MIFTIFSIFLWILLGTFLLATSFWLIEIFIIGPGRTGPIEHGLSAIQVRIVTIDNEAVVQATVDSLPTDIADVRVIAEREISISNATLHVVPEEFSCNASRKARAIEWARRTVPCTSTFVLYLDEDSVVQEFSGLPDADIVQLSERPIRSQSWIPYLTEIFRLGFQFEQRTFPNLRYPLYAWGGGFAVKQSVEDELTWDVSTVTEDTNFLWRAFDDPDRDLQFLNVQVLNQAPPTLRELVHQRRRWISGSLRDRSLLPRRYQILTSLRNTAWGLVVLSPVLVIPVVTANSIAFFPTYYRTLLIVQAICLSKRQAQNPFLTECRASGNYAGRTSE